MSCGLSKHNPNQIYHLSMSSSPPSSSTGTRSHEAKAILSLIQEGVHPKLLLKYLAPSLDVPLDADEQTLVSLLISILEPPKRKKLTKYNTIQDAIDLIKKSSKIVVLSGAGVSTSAGLPDFRSRNGIYVQINAEHPDLVDPKLMFDITYFRKNPLPFYQFSKALYPGQYSPTIGHQFIKCIEQHDKLLRNYTQNIDTLEKQAGIKRVIECHGSFAKATCTNCKYCVDGDVIEADVMNQKVPFCPRCLENKPSSNETEEDDENQTLAVMKPNIVFFGEQLSEVFHRNLEMDRDEVDLLIVIGSSMKVKPVALIPSAISPTVPQILINKESLNHMDFDIELLGDCDEIIQELCIKLGDDWASVCKDKTQPSKELDVESTLKLNKNDGPKPIKNADETDEIDVTSIEVDDNEGDWEDVEILRSSDESLDSSLKEMADIKIPKSSYVHIKPNKYLFHGVEITKGQLREYIKQIQSSTKGTSDGTEDD